MLERADIYDAELVGRLCGSVIPGPPALHPQRGLHTSHRRGASLEFSEHTEYVPGDDLRRLDWKVFAKSDRYFVRRFEDERLSRALFVVDATGSMAYGGIEEGLVRSKYHLAARVTAALAACLLRQGDLVGLLLVAEEPVYLPPSGGAPQLDALMEMLGGCRPGGKADFSAACADAGERLGRAAALYAVGDFLDEGEEELAVFGVLRARSVSPRLIHILHPDEVKLPFDQTTRFKDLEGPSELVLDPDGVRRAYFAEIRAFVERISSRAAVLGVPYALVRDDEEAGAVLPKMVRGPESRR